VVEAIATTALAVLAAPGGGHTGRHLKDIGASMAARQGNKAGAAARTGSGAGGRRHVAAPGGHAPAPSGRAARRPVSRPAAPDFGIGAGSDQSPDGAVSPARVGWREAIARTVDGLHYELVDVERAMRGLLRINIDRLPGQAYPTGDSEFVTVEDCEAVTRQLQYVLEVEGLEYARLEVSSPGLDRPLRNAADYQRFSGQAVSLTLKLPFQGRKVFKGVLEAAAATEALPAAWQLVFNDGKNDQVLAFALDEVREARLVPVLDFKGRQGKKTGATPVTPVTSGGAAPAVDGEQGL